MAYRDKMPQRTGKPVEVRSYLDLVTAQLARTELESRQVPAHVIEGASFNPLLAGAVGGHRLMVDESDLERADGILRRTEREVEVRDDEPEGTVRCPACETPYCRFGRPPLTLIHAHPIVLPLVVPYWLLSPKRWYCERCEHVWDDPKAGPKAMTPLAADDPRPVFLLFRGHAGAGLFGGAALGLLLALLLAGAFPINVIALVLVTFFGWYFGRVMGRFVCSEPSCRAPLTSDAETCPRCHGAVAGRVKWAAQHYASAADFRRELAAARAADEKKKPRKKKLLS